MNRQQERPTMADGLILSEDAVVIMPEIDQEAPSAPSNDEEMTFPKHKRFRPFLLVYLLVLLMLIIGSLIGFYGFLVNYEASTPNAALEQHIKWLRDKNYTAIYEAAGYEETLLNDKEAFLQYFQRIYAGDPQEITLRERPTAENGQKQFSVYFDDTRVSILDLIPVEDDNGWTVVPQLVYQDAYTIYASPETRITVNGLDLTLLGINAKPGQEAVFYGLNDPTLYPQVSCYTLEGLLNPPVIEGLTLSGESCSILQDTNDQQIVRVFAPATEEERLAQEEFAKNAAFTYAKFVARDASRNALLKLIYKESSLYESIRNFSNVWFPRHEKYVFEDVELINAARYTDTDFTCEVKFQPYYTQSGKTYDGEYVHYRMTFLLFEDEWKMIALTPIADNKTDDSATTSTTTTASGSTTTATTTTA